jgi:hypothetical protein
MDYITPGSTNGGCKEFTKSKVMVFHPAEGESCSVPAQDRPNTDTRRHRH